MKPGILRTLKIIALLAGLFSITAAQANSLTDYGATPVNVKPNGDQSTANQKLDFHTDLLTGRFNYRVPIDVPPGRQGSEPDIALQYNSSDGNGWCGVGWDLDMGYIQRETRYGVPISGASYVNSFTFSFAGHSGRLVLASDGTYRPEVNTAFLKFNFVSNTYWVITDKDGRQYTFGDTSNSRIFNNYLNGAFKWGLSKIVDANGNTTTITYQTYDLSAQLYPYQVFYNANTNSPTVAANCTVTFALETRSDIANSCLAGAEIDTTRRLRSITVTCNSSQVRQYVLQYIPSLSTGRSLLNKVTEYGTDNGVWFPPVTFDYSAQVNSFKSPVAWTITPQNQNDPSGYSPGTPDATLIDINGDGLPDWVTRPNNTPFNHFNVQLNTGSGFNSTVQSWSPLANEGNDTSTTWNTIDGSTSGFFGSGSQISSLLDMNGDLLPDRVMREYTGSTYSYFQMQTNTGTGFSSEWRWTGVSSLFNAQFTSPQLTIPILSTVDGKGSLDLLMDMNGDGFPDRVMIGSQNNQFDVQLNNRTGSFVGVSAWSGVTDDGGNYPYSPRDRSAPSLPGISTVYSELMDMNGDGLPDRIIQNGVQLNNGAGSFASLQSWGFSGYPETVSVTDGNYTTQFIDMNGDGLPDRVVSSGGSSYMVYFNTGKGFNVSGVTWSGVNTAGDGTSGWNNLQSWGQYGTKTMFIDMNGDGLVDRVIRNYTGASTSLLVQLNSGPFPDLLTGVLNGLGGLVTVAYTNSAVFNNSDGTRPRLPTPVYVVTSVFASDGIRMSGTTTYSYANGLYDTTWREFRGFGKVDETDPLGTKTVTYFHQGGGTNFTAHGEYLDTRYKAGMPFDVITYGSDGIQYQETLSQITQVQVDANGVYFPFVTNVIVMDSVAPGSYRATLKQYRYAVTNNAVASTGNLLKETDLGEVTNITYGYSFSDVADAPVYTTYVYTNLSNANIIDKPSSVTISSDAAANNVLRQTLYQYFGSTGNLQQKSELVCPGNYAVTQYTYDNYGNPQTTTDPMSLVTTVNYESTATYPVRKYTGTLTNGFQYDPRSGSLLFSTNEQGLVTANSYDTLLRPTNSATSTAANGAATLTRSQHQYSLNGISGSTSFNCVHSLQNDPAASGGYHETWTYLDGLGRVIQIRDQSETNGQFRVSDVFYDQRGNVMAQSWPFFSTGTSYGVYSGNFDSTYATFDAIGRPHAFYPFASIPLSSGVLTAYPTPSTGDSGSAVGPTTVTFNDGNNPWAVTVTDARNKVHKYFLDAFGRTNQIVEVTATTNYTTTLAYNPVGDLTNITDSAGNKIAMFFDLVGQCVAVADPDMGFWQYGYDLDGRQKTQTDAKGQQIRSFYTDPAGRLTRREGWNAAGQLVSTNTWTYDSSGGDSAYTVDSGQVYQITDDQGWQKFSYDPRNRTIKSVRYLSKNGNTYTNQFAFDDADRLTATAYPNGGPLVTNVFDAGQHLLQVRSGSTNFYTAKGFNALNQLNGITFGNGVATTLGYYGISRRLQQITTANAVNVQSLAYSYDAVGNVLNVVDGVYFGSASAGISSANYDDLNRLMTATWTGYGMKNYGYNSIGNVLTNGESGPSSYVYGTVRPHAVRTANGMWFTYDLNGNVVFRSGQRLDYDVNNRLWRVINTNGLVTTFGCAADGSRLWELSGTNALQVWIDGTYEEKQGQILFHVYAGGRQIATFDKTGTNVFQYYHSDNLTSTSIQTDQNGNEIQNYGYSAFGQSRYTQSSTVFKVSRRYTGQVLDDATGLYYYNARYYDPVLARFTQPDDRIPNLFDPQSYNRYSYCVNNPLRYTDPSGHAGAELDLDDTKGEINAEIRVSLGYNSRGERVETTEQRVQGALDQKVAEQAATVRGLDPAKTYIGPPETSPQPMSEKEMADFVRDPKRSWNNGPVPAGKTFDQARKEAFEKAGLTNPENVKFTKTDPKTGTVVEFKGPKGEKVSYDSPHKSPGAGHDEPHVGWQTGGKRSSGGTERGNIPYKGPQHPSRSPVKGEGTVDPH